MSDTEIREKIIMLSDGRKVIYLKDYINGTVNFNGTTIAEIPIIRYNGKVIDNTGEENPITIFQTMDGSWINYETGSEIEFYMFKMALKHKQKKKERKKNKKHKKKKKK
ncbi:MAG TPA: hypothetical protein VMI12_18065 [Puia sp.]|nr:hypothetical protein [Puia sp.]